MSKIEIGIIGAGGISSSVHLPLLTCIENVTIKFIADTFDPMDLAKVYNTKSIQISDVSSLPNCDIVVLATPVGAREEYIREFSKRDTAIFTEKPFATTLESHNQFLQMSNKISCNYMRIFYNSTRQIKNIISSGLFGSLKKITITEGGIIGKTNRGKDSYQADPKLSGGGILMESGCHTFSQLSFIFNDISVRQAKIVWQDNFDVDAQVIFDVLDNSTSIDYHITMLKPVESISRFFFEHAIVSFNHLVPNSIFNISDYHNKYQFTLSQCTEFANTFAQAYYLKWKSFFDNLSSNKTLDTKFETSLMTTQMTTDIFQKANPT
jgi:predicted dehydrogenase